jgi:ribosomal protein S27AE
MRVKAVFIDYITMGRLTKEAQLEMDALFEEGKKKCPKCGEVKLLAEFSKDKWARLKVESRCRSCAKAHADKPEIKAKKKAHADKPEIKAKKKAHDATPEAKAKRNARLKERRADEPSCALVENNRRRVNHFLNGNSKSVSSLKLVGCSAKDWKLHLGKHFQPGMSWANRKLWHVDHIIPCAAFVPEREEELFICFNYLNTRPMWGEENGSKGANYEEDDFIDYISIFSDKDRSEDLDFGPEIN